MLRPKILVLLLLGLLAACKPSQPGSTEVEPEVPIQVVLRLDASDAGTADAGVFDAGTVVWREGGDAGGLANSSAGGCLVCDGVTTYSCPGVDSTNDTANFWKRAINNVTIPTGAEVVGIEAKIYGASVGSLGSDTTVPVTLNDLLSLGSYTSNRRSCGSTTACDGTAGVVVLNPNVAESAVTAAWKTDGGTNQLIFKPNKDRYCLSHVQLTLRLKQRVIDVPVELDFDTQKLNRISAPRAMRVSNQGDAPLTVSNIAITYNDGIVTNSPFTIEEIGDAGTAATSFVLGQGEFKDIVLSFQPQQLGPATGYQLIIDSNAARPRTKVNLLGVGVDSSIDIQPNPYDFKQVRLGQSREIPVRFRNTDAQALSVSFIGFSGTDGGMASPTDAGMPFTLTDAGTPFTLPLGQSRELLVTFSPTVTGSTMGTLTFKATGVTDPSDSTEANATFTGEGVQPFIVFDPDAGLDFGKVTAGEFSSLSNVTIKNIGSEALTLQNVRVSENPAAFTLLTTPDGSVPLVADGGSLALSVRFTAPNDAGPVSGALEFTSTDGGLAPIRYALTGQSVQPDLVLEATDGGAFGEVRINKTPLQTVTLRNRGSGDILINNVEIPGSGSPFSLAADGGLTNFKLLAGGGQRELTLQFSPTTKTAPLQGNIRVSSEYTRFNPPDYVVTGQGVQPELVFEPVDAGVFGEVRVNGDPARMVRLRNKGTGTITLNGVGMKTGSSPYFTADAGPGGFSLAADAGREVWVRFRPTTQTGYVTGRIEASSDEATYDPEPYLVSGTGVQPVLSLSVDGGSDFGDVLVNTTPARVVTLRNTGSQDVTIQGVALNNALFDVDAGPSPSFLLPKTTGSKDVLVRFKPTTATSVEQATLSFTCADPECAALTQQFQGRGVRPELVLTPLDAGTFGDVRLNQTAERTVLLRNTGSLNVTIDSLSVSNGRFTADAGPGGFVLNGDGGERLVSLSFMPQTDSAIEQGTLTFVTNPAGFAPAGYTLQGRGVKPNVTVTPAQTLSFGEVRVGTDGGVKPVTLSNRGSGPIHFTDLRVEGDPAFSLEPPSTRTPTLPAQDGGLTLMVRFAPTSQTATDAGTLLLVSDDPEFQTQEINLAGEGVRPTLQMDAGTVTFAGQVVGTASAYQNVDVRNSGTGTLILDSLDASGPFELESATPLQVTGAAKNLRVRFKPLEQGAGTGRLTFTTNDPEHPSGNVPLSGTGTVELGVSPTTLAFNDVRNKTTGEQWLTLSNSSGVASITVQSLSIQEVPSSSHQFSIADVDGGLTLGPSDVRQVKVLFKPTTLGPAVGTLTLNSTASNGPQHQVPLTGRSTEAKVQITLPEYSPGTSTLDFGAVPVDDPSQSKKVRFSNAGDAPLSVSDVTIVKKLSDGGVMVSDSPFVYFGSRTMELGTDGGFVEGSVSFDPTQNTDYSATLVVTTSNGDPLTQELSMRGQGTAPQIYIDPASSLAFGAQRVGFASVPQQLFIQNRGLAPLVIQSTSNLADFTALYPDAGSPFPLNIPKGEGRSLAVYFKPTRTGFLDGGMSFNSNTLVAANPVSVSGTGIDGTLDLSRDGGSQLAFGGVDVNSQLTMTVKMRNAGQYPLTLKEARVDGAGMNAFLVSGFTQGLVLNPQDPYEFSVTFSPTQNGYQSNNLALLTDSQLNGIQNIQLTGTGLGAQVQFLAGSVVKFDKTNYGDFNLKGLNIKNSGVRTLVIDSITFDRKPLVGADGGVVSSDAGSTDDYDVTANFSVTRSADGGSLFPIHIDAGSQLELPLRFNPTSVGYKEAVATITSNTNPVNFDVNGEGTSPILAIKPDGGIIISGVMVDTVSFPQKIEVTNTGRGPITFSSIALTGVGKEFFEVTPAPETITPLTLEKEDSETFYVTFKPTQTNLHASASFVMTSDNRKNPRVNVPVEGHGETEPVTVENRLDFGAQRINDASQRRTLTVSSNTEGNVSLNQIKFDGPDAARFSLVSPSPLSPPYVLVRGKPMSLDLIFNPRVTGLASGKLQLTFSGGKTMEVELLGEGVPTAVKIGPAPLDFGGFRLGDPPKELPLTFENQISDPITLVKTKVDARDNYFTLLLDLEKPLLLQPNEPRVIMVRFEPKTETVSETTVSFGVEGKSWTADATIKGKSTKRILGVDPEVKDFGQVEANKSATATFTITNRSSKEQLVQAQLRSTKDSPFALDTHELDNPIPGDGGTARITLTFDPSNAGQAENAVLIGLVGVNESEAEVTVKGVGRVLTINGSGCSCGATEPGSAGALLLLALAAQRWRRKRES